MSVLPNLKKTAGNILLDCIRILFFIGTGSLFSVNLTISFYSCHRNAIDYNNSYLCAHLTLLIAKNLEFYSNRSPSAYNMLVTKESVQKNLHYRKIHKPCHKTIVNVLIRILVLLHVIISSFPNVIFTFYHQFPSH